MSSNPGKRYEEITKSRQGNWCSRRPKKRQNDSGTTANNGEDLATILKQSLERELSRQTAKEEILVEGETEGYKNEIGDLDKDVDFEDQTWSDGVLEESEDEDDDDEEVEEDEDDEDATEDLVVTDEEQETDTDNPQIREKIEENLVCPESARGDHDGEINKEEEIKEMKMDPINPTEEEMKLNKKTNHLHTCIIIGGTILAFTIYLTYNTIISFWYTVPIKKSEL